MAITGFVQGDSLLFSIATVSILSVRRTSFHFSLKANSSSLWNQVKVQMIMACAIDI
jgi:hypothetical protein